MTEAYEGSDDVLEWWLGRAALADDNRDDGRSASS